ncbi:hypothetical protein EVG20_g9194 [Dentipellis fragilis]|uniref:Uncharacterized protein n=1 Tax=Dentipellis fragilis TaxID=205917 RepID=A0A4Y9Y037_9AGAM|nr:hypothetical protein EVG20_g9194 [Dentipellis fragilis]
MATSSPSPHPSQASKSRSSWRSLSLFGRRRRSQQLEPDDHHGPDVAKEDRASVAMTEPRPRTPPVIPPTDNRLSLPPGATIPIPPGATVATPSDAATSHTPPGFFDPPPAPFVVNSESVVEYSASATSWNSDERSEDGSPDADEAIGRVTGMYDVDQLLKIPQFPRTNAQAVSVMALARSIESQRTARQGVAECGVKNSAILAGLWEEELTAATADVQQAHSGVKVLRSIIRDKGFPAGPETSDPSIQERVDKGKGREIT